MNRTAISIAAAMAICLGLSAPAQAQLKEQQIIQSASTVLDEIMAVPLRAVPQAMLADAQGIAVIPNIIKAGFVVGGRHGVGVLLVRDQQGDWQLPVFVKLTGGNIGWQAGVQSTDLILVFKTAKSVQGILQGKLTLGADAAVAAGPVAWRPPRPTSGSRRKSIRIRAAAVCSRAFRSTARSCGCRRK